MNLSEDKTMYFDRRQFMKDALGASIALGVAPSFLIASESAPKATTAPDLPDPYALVDPELIAAVKALPKTQLNADTLLVERKGPPWPTLPPPAPQPSRRVIPGPKGAPEVTIFIFDPEPGSKNRPALLHIHGGGYVAGHATQFPATLQKTAQDCGCLVISVEYRLAPETHFPGSLEDNYAALSWLHANADNLGVDRKRIAIGGLSAGGGHTAALAIAARDRKEIPVAFQLLIYPMLDDRTGSTRPVPPHIGTFIWTPQKNVFGWTSLLGKPAGSANVPFGAVPARVAKLEGLPPAFIGVGSLDLFVEEDIEYAKRLTAAGVPAELLLVPGAYHAFDLLVPDAAVSRRFTAYWTEALRRAFLKATDARP
jgi:acetyl esterase/lipase